MTGEGPPVHAFHPGQWLRIFFAGLCMGAADIVPGISGGTVAFIIGIYPQLLASLNSIDGNALRSLAAFRFREFFHLVHWQFLLALTSGIAVAFLTLAQLFTFFLNDVFYRALLYSTFFGLIVASVWFCCKLIKQWRLVLIFGLITGAVCAYMLTGTTKEKERSDNLYKVYLPLEITKSARNYDEKNQMLLDVPETTLSAMLAKKVISADTPVERQSDGVAGPAAGFTNFHFSYGLDLWVVCCGAIAISAMLLPGISGSYLLTILGMYGVVMAALADFVGGVKVGVFETEAFFLLASMVIGIVVGAVLFSRIVSWMLNTYHDMTIAVLTGFMIGALRTVWPFWSYEYSLLPLKPEKGPRLEVISPILPDVHGEVFWIGLAFAIAGFLIVFILEFLAGKQTDLKNVTR